MVQLLKIKKYGPANITARYNIKYCLREVKKRYRGGYIQVLLQRLQEMGFSHSAPMMFIPG